MGGKVVVKSFKSSLTHLNLEMQATEIHTCFFSMHLKQTKKENSSNLKEKPGVFPDDGGHK